MLSAALAFAGAVGTFGLVALRALFPDLPTWVALPLGGVGLVSALVVISRRFAWIMPWYYVLPAIVFLLTFTFFPVVLTIYLAFTDYAGIRNGQLNVSSTTEIVSVDGTRVTIADAANLNCRDLRDGCTGVRAEVYSFELLVVDAVAYEDGVLTLAAELPAGRDAREVELFLPELGFAFSTAIADIDGDRVVLTRAPPFPPQLEGVAFQMATDVARTIVRDDGVVLELNAPLPEGFEATAIARYNDYGFIGWRNFRTIVAAAQRSLVPVFVWNLTFAISTIVLNVAAGVLLAVLLNNPDLRFRNLYRTLLIIPWALPNIITIQVWRGFLNENFGAINRVLMLFDVTPEPINWLGTVGAARAAILVVNLWLGLPFMMTAVLGALSAIPRELYEAAKIDGATPLQMFTNVTWPYLKNLYITSTLLSTIWSLGDFNSVYLLTGGGPAELTHVLATLGIRYAFNLHEIGTGVACVMVAVPILVPLVIVLVRRLGRGAEA